MRQWSCRNHRTDRAPTHPVGLFDSSWDESDCSKPSGFCVWIAEYRSGSVGRKPLVTSSSMPSFVPLRPCCWCKAEYAQIVRPEAGVRPLRLRIGQASATLASTSISINPFSYNTFEFFEDAKRHELRRQYWRLRNPGIRPMTILFRWIKALPRLSRILPRVAPGPVSTLPPLVNFIRPSSSLVYRCSTWPRIYGPFTIRKKLIRGLRVEQDRVVDRTKTTLCAVQRRFVSR